MKKYLFIFGLAIILSVASINIATAAPGLQQGGKIHYVTFGESLYSIAAKYGVPAEVILRQNGLTNPDMIYAGQPLIIPGVYGNPTAHIAPSHAYGCVNYHTVSPGETLTGIAFNYNSSVQDLLRQNNLYNGDTIYVGQRICVPARGGYVPQPAGYGNYGPPPSYAPPVSGYHHTVARGETLNGIADHYGVDHFDVMRANQINNPGFIMVGQQLAIPGYQPAPLPSQPAPAYHQPVPVHSQPAPAYAYKDEGPKYAPPPAMPPVAPPPAPSYEDAYDDSGPPPPHKPPPDGADSTKYHDIPAPPSYQPSPVRPLMPEADHPIEVVINGGINWVDEIYPAYDDPNGITTLIVNADEKIERTVRMRSGDYEVKGELGLVPEFGIDRFRFAFKYIPPGDYDVWIDDPEVPSEKIQVKVEPGKRVEVAFRKGVSFSGPTFASPDGWLVGSWDNPSKPGKNLGGWSNILVKTPASGLWVKIESEGQGYTAKCFTGTKGPGACDFAGLSAGLYWIWIDGTDLTVKTYMDGNAYATFEFARQPSSEDSDKIGPVTYD